MPVSFRTEIHPDPIEPPITHKSSVLLVGSCFSSSMGSRFADHFFRANTNPTGILFNPMSMARTLESYMDQWQYSHNDLIQQGNRFVSPDHHGSLSSDTAEQTLTMINEGIRLGAESLRGATHIFLTFGTAHAYYLKSTGRVVANCHRMDPSLFERSLLTPEGISGQFESILDRLAKINPHAKIVLSVSPVRHLRNRPVENQLSKATLLLAVHRLIARNPQLSYFPAFELVMDDLRDYRFYARDMSHLTEQAEDYIWDKLTSSIMSNEVTGRFGDLKKLRDALNHRPTGEASSRGYQGFLAATFEELDRLTAKYSDIDFSPVRRELHARMRNETFYRE